MIPELILLAGATCSPITGDRILVSDIVKSVPALSALPADTMVGYAPVPGARRIFRPDELVRFAKLHGLSMDVPRSACVEWPTRSLSDEQILGAMRRTPELQSARIEIIDRSRSKAPAGEIQFPKQTLQRPATSSVTEPVMWRGFITYAPNKRFPIWAKVRIAVSMTRVVATHPITAGDTILASKIRLETADEFPFTEGPARSADDVVDRVSRRSITEGSPISRLALAQPFAIAKGDTITVEAKNGAAHISIEGKAESAGRAGEMISVRNVTSGKIFRARVDGKGKASVQP
jgi:flagella basal body P-ring formation protein FlgA